VPTADEVASVIIARSGPWLDAMSLQKLLYYVQAWHLAVTDEPLFEEQFQAWKDGPVVPEVRQARKERSTRRAARQDADGVALDAATSNLIDLVLRTYGSMSAEELSALTHVEEPWREARGDLPPDARCTKTISRKSMARFYRAHRRLDGRTASDLAAAGVQVSSSAIVEPVDIDAILESFGPDVRDAGSDPWGGANLALTQQDEVGEFSRVPRRADAGA
jgi:uncharacterized phage-associated protein